nr:MAG TPA: hypothetical protein [Caudoviricetes sp.]
MIQKRRCCLLLCLLKEGSPSLPEKLGNEKSGELLP